MLGGDAKYMRNLRKIYKLDNYHQVVLISIYISYFVLLLGTLTDVLSGASKSQ